METYKMCVNNVKSFLKHKDIEDTRDAFLFSEILSIAFCKNIDDVLLDILREE